MKNWCTIKDCPASTDLKHNDSDSDLDDLKVLKTVSTSPAVNFGHSLKKYILNDLEDDTDYDTGTSDAFSVLDNAQGGGLHASKFTCVGTSSQTVVRTYTIDELKQNQLNSNDSQKDEIGTVAMSSSMKRKGKSLQEMQQVFNVFPTYKLITKRKYRETGTTAVYEFAEGKKNGAVIYEARQNRKHIKIFDIYLKLSEKVDTSVENQQHQSPTQSQSQQESQRQKPPQPPKTPQQPQQQPQPQEQQQQSQLQTNEGQKSKLNSLFLFENLMNEEVSVDSSRSTKSTNIFLQQPRSTSALSSSSFSTSPSSPFLSPSSKSPFLFNSATVKRHPATSPPTPLCGSFSSQGSCGIPGVGGGSFKSIGSFLVGSPTDNKNLSNISQKICNRGPPNLVGSLVMLDDKGREFSLHKGTRHGPEILQIKFASSSSKLYRSSTVAFMFPQANDKKPQRLRTRQPPLDSRGKPLFEFEGCNKFFMDSPKNMNLYSRHQNKTYISVRKTDSHELEIDTFFKANLLWLVAIALADAVSQVG